MNSRACKSDTSACKGCVTYGDESVPFLLIAQSTQKGASSSGRTLLTYGAVIPCTDRHNATAFLWGDVTLIPGCSQSIAVGASAQVPWLSSSVLGSSPRRVFSVITSMVKS